MSEGSIALMATFFITTASEYAYEKVMEIVRQRSLTFSKYTKNGTYHLEIIGESDDFHAFGQTIASMRLNANIQEGV